VGFSQVLDVGGDVHRLQRPELAKPHVFTPAEEVRCCPGVGSPCVAVADVGGEELDEAPGGVRAGGGPFYVSAAAKSFDAAGQPNDEIKTRLKEYMAAYVASLA
jgi:hypothetical protein